MHDALAIIFVFFSKQIGSAETENKDCSNSGSDRNRFLRTHNKQLQLTETHFFEIRLCLSTSKHTTDVITIFTMSLLYKNCPNRSNDGRHALKLMQGNIHRNTQYSEALSMKQYQ